ncbi:MAG: type IV toxin-antitoxin system AbiEi family antitoxin [Gammaproteobacteria bacterium]|nr:type IV toxin-antitoxin system AbiEi family antitoxin [Gammaproteobacteria bacterium]
MCSVRKVRARELIVEYAAFGKHHFTFSEFHSTLGTTAVAARQALSRLIRKGEIASPARGFYVIVPPEYRRIGCLPADEFIPALMEYRNTTYYVGILSAAQYFGAAHQRPQQFQVVLARNRPVIACGKVKVAFVARKNIDAVPTVRLNNPRGSIVVSSVEATALDLVGYMHRAGGVDRVAGLLSEIADELNANRLVAASESASILWAQRLGYLLELVGAARKTALLKKRVHQHARNFTKLLPSIDAKIIERSKEWRVLVNANVDPEE